MIMGFDDKGKCLACRTGEAMDRTNRTTGEMFLGCSNYPICKNSAPYREFGPRKQKSGTKTKPPQPYEQRLGRKRFRFR